MLQGIVQTIVPGSTDWNAIARDPEKKDLMLRSLDSGHAFDAIIETEIRRAHASLAVQIPEPIPQAMKGTLAQHFRCPFEFECEVIRGVVKEGWPTSAPGKRNAVWDAQIAF